MGRWRRFSWVVGLVGLSVLACGTGPREAMSVRSSPKAAVVSPRASVDLPEAYLVPPDWARIPVRIELRGPTRAEVLSAVRAEHQRLAEAYAEVEGCGVEVVDYTPPTLVGRDILLGTMELRVHIDLTGMVEVATRMERLDACTEPLDGFLQPSEDRYATTKVGPGAMVLGLTDPQRHYDAVVQRQVDRLQQAADSPGAPQLHPTELRCVPRPDVQIGARTLSGLVLTVPVECRIEPTGGRLD